MILGWQVLCDGLPGILLAVPYSSFADKHGRKWVLLLNVAGIVMSMFWKLIADVVPMARRYELRDLVVPVPLLCVFMILKFPVITRMVGSIRKLGDQADAS